MQMQMHTGRLAEQACLVYCHILLMDGMELERSRKVLSNCRGDLYCCYVRSPFFLIRVGRLGSVIGVHSIGPSWV